LSVRIAHAVHNHVPSGMMKPSDEFTPHRSHVNISLQFRAHV
jgi:hypothetical protein